MGIVFLENAPIEPRSNCSNIHLKSYKAQFQAINMTRQIGSFVNRHVKVLSQAQNAEWSWTLDRIHHACNPAEGIESFSQKSYLLGS